jgi:hypothetical protein
MQLGVSSEERLRRVAARKLVSEMLGGVTDAPRLLPGGKRTHMAVWTNEGGATDVKLFLVHLGEGRTHPQQVALPPEFRGHTAEAWLDFDRREDGTIEEGVLTVPGFSHAAIVHLTPGEDG